MNAPMPDHDSRVYAAPHNTTHPVGRRGVTGVHHADDCPMRAAGATGCVCGREGERAVSDQSLREAVDDLRAWVAMQHEASGMDSSDQAAGEFHAYKRVLSHLLKILATHRVESAKVQVEITDASVGAARTAYSKACRDIPSDGPARFRAALEAAAPLLGPRPLLDRETVRERIWRSLAGTGLGGIFRDDLAEAQADAVMDLVRPMPTREQIDTAIAGKPIVRSADKPSDWRGGLSPNEIDDLATIVLALLNGAES